MTPADLRSQADDMRTQAAAARDRGDARLVFILMHQEQLLRALAAEMEARGQQVLTKGSAVVQDAGMTEAQMKDRAARQGRSRAKTMAAGNALLEAIANDTKGEGERPRWGSGRDYCARRLKIAPASLSNYMNGVSPCPAPVDKKVREDFPHLFKPKVLWSWPRGVVS